MIHYTKYILFLAILFFTNISHAQTEAKSKSGIKWKSYDEAVKEAKKKNKLIVIDVYTSWCSWCKVMDKSTFTDESVIKYMDKKYVGVKLNAEGSNIIHYKNIPLTEREFAQKILSVSSFPTSTYLNKEEEIISNIPGYLEAKVFKKVLVFFAEGYYKKQTWQEFDKSYHE